MPATPPTWTDERLELLKVHFAAGLSCREIAGEIGVTRNAVIGKLSRLNLTRDNDGRRPARKPTGQEARPKARGKRPRALPRLHYQMLVEVYGRPAANDEPVHSADRCSLLELSEQKCRWPINTPGAADFCFCGNMPVDGLPYCPGHTRLAYRPGSRQRVAQG
jgi:GcrA cell cycle regulator